MLKTFIIICLIIAIIVAVYILLKKNDSSNPEKSKTQILLDNVAKAFNLTGGEKFLNENFVDVNVVFKNLDDIKNNMMTFLEYACPEMNIDEINSLLKEYGVNKTMQQIFDEHKNDNTTTYFNNFKLFEYVLFPYTNVLFKETDDNKMLENFRLYMIVFLAIQTIYTKNLYNFPFNRNYGGTEYTINNIELQLSPDYKTNNIVSLYLRTNNNKDISLDNAIDALGEIEPGKISDRCLSNILCKNSVDIAKDFITPRKNKAVVNMINVIKYFNLSIVLGLLKLNGSDTTNLEADKSTISDILTSASLKF